MGIRLPALLAALVVAGLMASCSGDGDGRAVALPPGCRDVNEPPAKKVDLRRPQREVTRSAQISARVETSCGAFTIRLDAARSPKTVSSFVHLVQAGLYDGTTFHRIVPNFVIQGGDPEGDGTGGPGYFVDEPPPSRLAYVRGTVAMARSSAEPPGRSGSQFYVVVAADAGLSPGDALLGKVASGMAVVDRIAEVGDPGSGDKGTPLAPVVIDRIELRR